MFLLIFLMITSEAMPIGQQTSRKLSRHSLGFIIKTMQHTMDHALELNHLPNDAMHKIMEYLDFTDSLALTYTHSFNQPGNPLKRQNLNPLVHHAAGDDQVLNLLLRNTDQERLEAVMFLLQNPTVNPSKLLEYITKTDLYMHFFDILESKKQVLMLMYLAAKLGKMALFRFLIENLNLDPTSRGNLALLLACQEGRLEIVDYLLDLVDPRVPDHLCLVLASHEGHENVVERLLRDQRIDPTFNNYAAAIQASMRRFETIVDLIFMDDRVDREEFALAVRPQFVDGLPCIMFLATCLMIYIMDAISEHPRAFQDYHI